MNRVFCPFEFTMNHQEDGSVPLRARRSQSQNFRVHQITRRECFGQGNLTAK
jgi:hypothetical protein